MTNTQRSFKNSLFKVLLKSDRLEIKLKILTPRLIRDEPLGWTEIPLNQIQYGSDYTSATEKWFHLSTLRRTGKKDTVNVGCQKFDKNRPFPKNFLKFS